MLWGEGEDAVAGEVVVGYCIGNGEEGGLLLLMEKRVR